MYNALLHAHSGFRWIVLILLLITVAKAWISANKEFTRTDKMLVKFSVLFSHIQLLVGIVLYFVSPLISSFIETFPATMKDQTLRYFGMEHSLMMIIAIVLITIGSAKSKKASDDRSKFKAVALWFTIALAIIFLMTPWSFFPFNPNRGMF